jgi:hypothetical protein
VSCLGRRISTRTGARRMDRRYAPRATRRLRPPHSSVTIFLSPRRSPPLRVIPSPNANNHSCFIRVHACSFVANSAFPRTVSHSSPPTSNSRPFNPQRKHNIGSPPAPVL